MLAKFPAFVSLSTEEIYNCSSYTFRRATNSGKLRTGYWGPIALSMEKIESSSASPLKCSLADTDVKEMSEDIFDLHSVKADLIQKIVYDALVWCSLNGLVVGDRTSPKSGVVPGVGLIHAPVSLFPTFFPESKWKQARELAPVLNELVDRVSLDSKFLQESLSRTRKVDAFTSRLLDIHSKMLEMNKKEEIRLGLHRSDYMLDKKTNLLLQIELNTISSSFPALSCLVSELHRSLLRQYKDSLDLDPKRIPENNANSQFAAALYKAWAECNNPKAVVLVVVQNEERNMYDQHWLFTVLMQRYNVRSIRKTLGEVGSLGKLLSDGTLDLDGEAVSVVYFRAGYTPTDYPSELEWEARLLIEQSNAVKCPSIAYHLAGTKKIQQELAKPNQLERFLNNKDEIEKVRKCFAGLWSLEDSKTVENAKEKPELYVMKPQREGGGNNIYGDGVRIALEQIEKAGNEEDAAYILMQRIFPTISSAVLLRDGTPRKDHALSELGIYGRT